MPLHPLFADRLDVFSDNNLDFNQKLEIFNAPLSDYISPAIKTTDVTVASPDALIPIRVYRPEGNTDTLPALLWFHGGGFTEGGLWQNESDVVSRELAHRTPMVVVAVDYRLCNDGVLFPAPQEDGLAALQWLIENASQLSINSKQIYLGGISAGGALSAALAVRQRDLGMNAVKGLLLSCPLLHHTLPEYSEELQNKLAEVGGFGINRDMVDGLNKYLTNDSIQDAPRWWFAGEVDDHTGFPATQIINCEYDALRSSGEKFAEQLLTAGVDVEVMFEPGTPHAHINRYPQDCEPMDNTLNSMAAFIKSRI